VVAVRTLHTANVELTRQMAIEFRQVIYRRLAETVHHMSQIDRHYQVRSKIIKTSNTWLTRCVANSKDRYSSDGVYSN